MVSVVNHHDNKKYRYTFSDWILHFISGYRELEIMVKMRDKTIEELRKNAANKN